MSQKINISKNVNQANYVLDKNTKSVRATVTDLIGLEKPLTSDYYNIDVHNNNMEKIDNYFKDFQSLNKNQCYETTISESMWEDSDGLFGVRITHNLGTKMIYVAVLDSVTYECIFTGYTCISNNEIYLKNDDKANCIVMIISAASKTVLTSATIDDTITSTQRTWSSNKITKEIEKKTVDLSHLATKEEVSQKFTTIESNISNLQSQLGSNLSRAKTILSSLSSKVE